jgi:hypothetical protein
MSITTGLGSDAAFALVAGRPSRNDRTNTLHWRRRACLFSVMVAFPTSANGFERQRSYAVLLARGNCCPCCFVSHCVPHFSDALPQENLLLSQCAESGFVAVSYRPNSLLCELCASVQMAANLA